MARAAKPPQASSIQSTRRRSKSHAANAKTVKGSTRHSSTSNVLTADGAPGAVRDAERLWKEIRSHVRGQAPKDESGFLAVRDYVEHVFERHGQDGCLTKENFSEAVGEVMGDPLTPAEADEAFLRMDKGAGNQGVLTVDEFMDQMALPEGERREAVRRLRECMARRFGKRAAQLRELFDYLAAPNRGDFVSTKTLCEFSEEWLKADVTEEEARFMLGLMDLDRDAMVSLDDFMAFMGPQGDDVVDATGLAARLASAIVDIKVSASKAEEAELDASGYKMADANLNEGTFGRPVHLWYRRRRHGGAGARLRPVVDVMIDSKNVNSALVVDGYQCVRGDLNSGNPLGKPTFLWIRRATSDEEEARDAVVDVAVTTGRARDRTNAIYNPPARGFVQVPGNLNKRTLGKDIFLWYRPIKSRQPALHAGASGFHVAASLTEERRKTEMAKNIRRQIRQHVAPAATGEDPAALADYAALFNAHGGGKIGRISRRQLQDLLAEVGLNVEAKDLQLVLGRLDNVGKKYVTREEFLQFVALTDDEMDEVCEVLRRKHGARSAAAKNGRLRREQTKSLRRKFEQLDHDGDGLLSRQDMGKMLGEAGIHMTAAELERLRSRFDTDGDGRVDLLNFLNFFVTRDNIERRSAARVGRAVEVLRDHVLSMQTDKLKKKSVDHIDSQTAWQDIKRRHLLAYSSGFPLGAPSKAFPGFLTADDVGRVLERLNVRLSLKELHQMVLRMAPLGSGRISEEDFHKFTVMQPRLEGQMLRVAEKEALPALVEAYRRVRHKQHRRNFQERTFGASATFANDAAGGGGYGATALGAGGGDAAGGLGGNGVVGDGGGVSGNTLSPGKSWRERGAAAATAARHGSPTAFHRCSPTSPMQRNLHGGPETTLSGPLTGTNRGLTGRRPASAVYSPAAAAVTRGGASSWAAGTGHGGGGGATAKPTLAWDDSAISGSGGDDEGALRDAYARLLDECVRALRPDDQGWTTVEHVRDGVAALAHRDAADFISAAEWAALAQLVGADEPEHYVVDARRLLEGICAAALSEAAASGGFAAGYPDAGCSTDGDGATSTDRDTLDLVCDDLVAMIQEEARQEDGLLDYAAPFKLFDENGDGVIPADEFRRMLYRLNVDVLLRDAQIVELMGRFDVDRTGEITIKEFIAFAERETWGNNNNGGLFGGGGTFGRGTFSGGRSRLHSGTRGGAFFSGEEGENGGNGGGEDDAAGDDGSGNARMHGLLVTGSRAGDELAAALARRLREKFPGKPRAAEGELRESFLAADYHGDGRLPAATILTALKRVGLDPGLRAPVLDRALCVFAVGSGHGGGDGGGRGDVDYGRLLAAVGKAWRAADLAGVGKGGLTGDARLDRKICALQKEFRRISQVKATDPETGAVTYSYKMGKAFRKLDANGDGVLAPQEFKMGLRRLGIGADMKEKDVRAMFRAFDADADGGIDYREFCDFLLHGTVIAAGRGGGGGRRSGGGHGDDGGSSDGGSDDGSGEDFFGGGRPPPGPWAAVADAACRFAPNETLRRRVEEWFHSRDATNTGTVSEKRFREFLKRSGIDEGLSTDQVADIVMALDPRCTGALNYRRFLELAFAPPKKADGCDKDKKKEGGGGGAAVTALLHRLQEAILLSLARGRPYHGLFRLSDEAASGLVPTEAFGHTLRMLGPTLSKEEAQMVADALPARADAMVDYEELYRLLLRTPPPPHLSPGGGGVSRNGGGGGYGGGYGGGGGGVYGVGGPRTAYRGGLMCWPPPVSFPDTAFGEGLLGAGGTGNMPLRGDPLLEDVAARVRQRLLEKTQQWGPSFSLARQFEFHDARNRGFVSTEDFLAVLQQMGVYLSAAEVAHLLKIFDRYNDGGIDYNDFCQRMLFDCRELQQLAHKLAVRFAALRARGVEVRSAFEMYDLSKTGWLSRRDFRESLRRLQLPVTEHQAQSLSAEFAQLGDADAVAYEDFLSFVHSATSDGGGGGGGGDSRHIGGYTRGSYGCGSDGGGCAPHWAGRFAVDAGGYPGGGGGSYGDDLRKFRQEQDADLRRAPNAAPAGSAAAADTDADRARTRFGDAQARLFLQHSIGNGGTSGGSVHGHGSISSARGRNRSRSPGCGLGGRGHSGRSPSPAAQAGAELWGARTPLRSKGSLTLARQLSDATAWLCPVCFYTENPQGRTLCEICNAPNPDATGSQVSQQCPNCTYVNCECAVECAMCAEGLPYGLARDGHKHNPYKKIGSRNGGGGTHGSGKENGASHGGRRAKNSGWGGGSDGSDSEPEGGQQRRHQRLH